MATKGRAGMQELIQRVQTAFHLSTKKEAEQILGVLITCLEETLVSHLDKDGYCIKLNGLGKFAVHHRPSIRRKIGFSGEIREIPPKYRVKFVSLGKLRRLGNTQAKRLGGSNSNR